MRILNYREVLDHASTFRKVHLILGNGFSIALKPDIFSYGSLFENAEFGEDSHLPKLFEALGTQDFETVISYLEDSAKVVEVYRPRFRNFVGRLRADSALVKDALVTAIAQRHPDRFFSIEAKQFQACRTFLSTYDHIFTLNYDVLLYWALMQNEIDNLSLFADDGFRHPEGDPDAPYVSWQEGQSAKVHYLHGALHLFDAGTEIIKYTWSKTDVAIVDQIRQALDESKFPVFVAEGSSESKVEKILHNAYLHKAYRSLESCCDNGKAAVVIFGHALASNDDHVLTAIERGKTQQLFVSLFGDPNDEPNQQVVQRAEQLSARRRARGTKFELEISFYQAESAGVWG